MTTPWMDEEERKKQEEIAAYIEAQKGQAEPGAATPAPTEKAPESGDVNPWSYLGVALSGVGDAYSASAGRNQNAAQGAMGIIDAERKRKQDAIREYLANKKEGEKAEWEKEKFGKEQAQRERESSRTDDRARELAQLQRENQKLMAESKQKEADTVKSEKDAEKLASLQIPGYELGDNVRPQAPEAQKAREAVASLATVKQDIERLDGLIDKYGSFEYGGPNSAEMSGLARSIQLNLKSLFDLGVLQPADLKLLEGMVKDPGDMRSFFTRGDSSKASLKTLKDRLDIRAGEKLKIMGYKKAGEENTPKEVARKTADGKLAVFDAETKQFLRYAQ